MNVVIVFVDRQIVRDSFTILLLPLVEMKKEVLRMVLTRFRPLKDVGMNTEVLVLSHGSFESTIGSFFSTKIVNHFRMLPLNKTLFHDL